MWLDEELDNHPSSLRPPPSLGQFPALIILNVDVDPGLDDVLTSSPPHAALVL